MTTDQRKEATRWFASKVYRELDARADLDVDQIFTAISDLDDWFNAAPVATETTNQAQILMALPTAFKNGTTAVQKALLLAAVALGRAGLL